jgi:hypothetical protein
MQEARHRKFRRVAVLDLNLQCADKIARGCCCTWRDHEAEFSRSSTNKLWWSDLILPYPKAIQQLTFDWLAAAPSEGVLRGADIWQLSYSSSHLAGLPFDFLSLIMT